MSAEVESMFYARETPWHGLGTFVKEAVASREALINAGLDWEVIQKNVVTHDGIEILGYKANVRDIDNKVLGIVSDRYQVVQNRDAFAFTDELLGEGVTYETAGSLQEGRRIWLLANMPNEYVISGERIKPYLLFTTAHDGTGSVRIAITPVRVVCKNTLNLALKNASRSFSMMHTTNINNRIQEAHKTLFKAERYMDELGKEIEVLRDQIIPVSTVKELITELIPVNFDATDLQIRNAETQRNNLLYFYKEAPDLKGLDTNAYRFINAVSDFATHSNPIRKTKNYRENLFMKTMDGNPMIDRAYQLIKAV